MITMITTTLAICGGIVIGYVFKIYTDKKPKEDEFYG